MRPMYDKNDLLHVANPLGGRWALQATHMLYQFSRNGPDYPMPLCTERGKCCVVQSDPLFGDDGWLKDEIAWEREMTSVTVGGSYRERSEQYLVAKVHGQHLALLCQVPEETNNDNNPAEALHLVRVKHVDKWRVTAWKKPRTYLIGDVEGDVGGAQRSGEWPVDLIVKRPEVVDCHCA